MYDTCAAEALRGTEQVETGSPGSAAPTRRNNERERSVLPFSSQEVIIWRFNHFRHFGTFGRRFGVSALWRFGALAFWRFGALALWRFGALAVWRFGDLAGWRNLERKVKAKRVKVVY